MVKKLQDNDIFKIRRLEEELKEKFSFISEISFFDFGRGWDNLIIELCESIKNICEKHKVSTKVINVYELREKYGELTVGYLVDESIVENEVNISEETIEKIKQDISQIVSLYENRSWIVCSRCGENGENREIRGWIEVLCDECYCKCNIEY